MTDNLFSKEFTYSGYSFEESVGNADPRNDAVGRIAMNFAVLEDYVSSAISFLLKTTQEKGLLVTSEMSFRAKLNVLASLMRMEYQSGRLVNPIPERDFQDLLFMCHKSEELRNRLLHSSWVYDHSKQEIRRRKLSAKTKRGFVMDEEALTPGQVLDIADYIIYTAESIEEFFVGTYPTTYVRALLHVISP